MINLGPYRSHDEHSTIKRKFFRKFEAYSFLACIVIILTLPFVPFKRMLEITKSTRNFIMAIFSILGLISLGISFFVGISTIITIVQVIGILLGIIYMISILSILANCENRPTYFPLVDFSKIYEDILCQKCHKILWSKSIVIKNETRYDLCSNCADKLMNNIFRVCSMSATNREILDKFISE